MIDGGIWANNPVMNAVVDALACFDIPRENLRVLSIGTGDRPSPSMRTPKMGDRSMGVHANLQRGGARPVQECIRSSIPAERRSHRSTTIRSIAMDDLARSLTELPELARSLAEGSGYHIRSLFLGERVEPFVGCPVNPGR
jgi:uncharacterized protein